jgi:hypothetical protein
MKGILQARQNNYQPKRPFHGAEPCRPWLSAGTQTCYSAYFLSLPALVPLPARHRLQLFHMDKQVSPLFAGCARLSFHLPAVERHESTRSSHSTRIPPVFIDPKRRPFPGIFL